MRPRTTGAMPHQHITRASWLTQTAAGAGTIVLWPTVLRAQTTSLRIGTGAVEANAQIFYAQDQGFFKKAGLDVDIHINRAGSTTAAAVIGATCKRGSRTWSRSVRRGCAASPS